MKSDTEGQLDEKIRTLYRNCRGIILRGGSAVAVIIAVINSV